MSKDKHYETVCKAKVANNLVSMVTGFFLVLTFLSGLVLSSNFVSADDSVVDDIIITSPVSCTLSGTGMNTHNANIANGTYQSNIGTTTLKIYCNDNNGFSIYAAGYTGNEIGETNSNKLIGTSASGNAMIDTGTATSAGNPDVSNWAMKLSTVTSPSPSYPITITTGYDDYHAVPNEYTKVATRLSNTDLGQAAQGATLTTTYAAYISKTQSADTYSGKVIYTLVHPHDYPISDGCKSTGTTISTIVCMQDISSSNKASILASMSEGVQYTLKDKRDDKIYTVAKLADDNIWMTQNLDLDLDSTTTYTNLDTDLGWNSSLNGYTAASWMPSLSTYTTAGTWTYSVNTPESYDPGNLYWSGTPDDDTLVSSGIAQYHLGNYYNWTAAVAMNNSSSFNTDGQMSNQSICPSGWTLPIGDYFSSDAPTKSFQYMLEQYDWDGSALSDQDIWEAPLYFGINGEYDSSLNEVGSYSYYWSSVVNDSEYAYELISDSGPNVYPGDYYNRDYGVSVRCVARW